MTETTTISAWRKWRGCERKIPYTSEWTARNAAIAWGWNGYPSDVYECEHCDGWHLTSRTSGDDHIRVYRLDGRGYQ